MTDPWWFYFEQLSGLDPETTPGTPWSGYYVLRRRWTRENDDPNRKPGDPRKKVTIEHVPVAIWHDGDWFALVGREEFYRDVEQIDAIFSRACRNAITFDEYERMRHEDERTDQRDFCGAGKGAGRDSEPFEG